jgi:hypothetical protein
VLIRNCVKDYRAEANQRPNNVPRQMMRQHRSSKDIGGTLGTGVRAGPVMVVDLLSCILEAGRDLRSGGDAPTTQF